MKLMRRRDATLREPSRGFSRVPPTPQPKTHVRGVAVAAGA